MGSDRIANAISVIDNKNNLKVKSFNLTMANFIFKLPMIIIYTYKIEISSVKGIKITTLSKNVTNMNN